MLKRFLCLVLVIAFAFSIGACGGDDDSGEKVVFKPNRNGVADKDEGEKGSDANDGNDTAGNEDGSNSDGSNSDGSNSGTGSSGTGSGGTGSSGNSGGVSVNVGDGKVLETKLAKSDFGGQSFVFYYWYEYGDIIDRKIELFNRQHNAKVSAQVISGSFEENIAKSIASGRPYDLIANHGIFFPNSIFLDIYEELSGYIDERDYFNASKPQNGGISKTVNAEFSWRGKLYACGSAKSVLQNVIYYNKLMFQNAGLEDPYQLWKNGQWTWNKFVTMGRMVTDVANNIGFLSAVDLTVWWTMCGVSPVNHYGDTYTENLGSQEIITATQQYANLYFGYSPISVAKTGSTAFNSGKAYTMVSSTDAYDVYAMQAKKSGQFGRNANNLGVVPVPSGLAKGGKYPGHAAMGYSAAKGAKEPSLPCAYALFESRVVDSEVSGIQLPVDVRNYVEEQFAVNGFLGFSGLENSEGESSRTYLDKLGAKIRNGEDPISTVANARYGLTRMINDSVANEH